MPNVFTDIDSSMAFGPEFVSVVSDRLRRVVAAIPASTAVAAPVASGSGGGGGGTVSGLPLVVETALGASPVVVASPATPTAGQLVVVFITQDATGGRAFTWHADYHNGPTDGINPDANATTVLLFCGRSDSKWWRLPWAID